jgi:hypothetical protein
LIGGNPTYSECGECIPYYFDRKGNAISFIVLIGENPTYSECGECIPHYFDRKGNVFPFIVFIGEKVNVGNVSYIILIGREMYFPL